MSPTSVLAEYDIDGNEIDVEKASWLAWKSENGIQTALPNNVYGQPEQEPMSVLLQSPDPQIIDGKYVEYIDPGDAIYDLLDKVSAYPGLDPDYVDKMVHKIPRAPVFNRVDYLLKAVEGKVVLDLGASGPAAVQLQEAAKEYHGVDWELNDKVENFYQLDIESLLSLPAVPGLELIVAGEIIEHLSNAGRFLKLLHTSGVPVILTTPNARSIAGGQWGDRGTECVNKDHVAWYSYHTLKTLIERHDFELYLWGWYNGKPYTAEGLIFHMGAIK